MGTAPLLPVPRGAAPGARPGTAHTPPPLPPAPAAALGPVPPLTGHADSSAQPLRPTRCRRGGAPRPGPAHLGGTDGRTHAGSERPAGPDSLPPWLAAPPRPAGRPFQGEFPGGRADVRVAAAAPRPGSGSRPRPAPPARRAGEARSGAERSAAAGGWGGPRPLTPGPGRRRRGSVGGRCGEKPPPPQREGAGPPAPSLPFAAGRSKRNKKRNAVCWSPPTPGHSSGT